MRGSVLIACCLIMAGCASTPPHANVDEHGCRLSPPPQLAIIQKVRAEDGATAWRLDMHGTGIHMVTDSSTSKPILVLERGQKPSEVRTPDALGAELLCVADPLDNEMYSVRGLSDKQIYQLLKGFGAGDVLRFKFLKDGVVKDQSITRLGYTVEG